MKATSMKVANTHDLIALNTLAIHGNKNRTLDESVYSKLDPNGLHILDIVMIHNDVEWRCLLLAKVKQSMKPLEAMLDVDFDVWDRLHTVEELKRLQEAAR